MADADRVAATLAGNATMTDDQVAAYLEHVRALIKTSQTKPGDTETEHAIVTELFPGFVAAAEAALKLADEWAQRLPGDPVSLPSLGVAIAIQQDCGAKVREAITAALTGTQPSEDGSDRA